MCSIKKAVLKIFAIFTGKYLCWSLHLIKLQALDFRNIDFEEHLQANASVDVWQGPKHTSSHFCRFFFPRNFLAICLSKFMALPKWLCWEHSLAICIANLKRKFVSFLKFEFCFKSWQKENLLYLKLFPEFYLIYHFLLWRYRDL